MWAFLKKDILVLLRDRTELAVLLLMPFILIVILGFALRGLMMGNTEALNMQVAMVQDDDEQAGIEQFTAQLETLQLPEEAIAGLSAAAAESSPFRTIQQVLASPELEEIVEVEKMDLETARRALAEEEITAILTIPEDFTRVALDKLLLGNGPGATVELTIEDSTSTQADVFETIITQVAEELNFEAAVSRLASEEEGMAAAAVVSQEVSRQATVYLPDYSAAEVWRSN